MPHLRLLLAVVAITATNIAAHSSRHGNSEYDIKTLPPTEVYDDSGNLRVADALLSDWEGQHWASLDADEDKVALSWTTDKEYITFQVGEQKQIKG